MAAYRLQHKTLSLEVRCSSSVGGRKPKLLRLLSLEFETPCIF